MYDNVNARVTYHAHQQYCSRVEPVDRQELAAQCTQQLQAGDYGYNKDWFIHLSGVWWVYNIQAGEMVLITCYGRTSIDMPAALKWAKRHNDRIAITGMGW